MFVGEKKSGGERASGWWGRDPGRPGMIIPVRCFTCNKVRVGGGLARSTAARAPVPALWRSALVPSSSGAFARRMRAQRQGRRRAQDPARAPVLFYAAARRCVLRAARRRASGAPDAPAHSRSDPRRRGRI